MIAIVAVWPFTAELPAVAVPLMMKPAATSLWLMMLPTAAGLVIATIVGGTCIIGTCSKLSDCVGVTLTDEDPVTTMAVSGLASPRFPSLGGGVFGASCFPRS